jgi:hypothetical protein
MIAVDATISDNNTRVFSRLWRYCIVGMLLFLDFYRKTIVISGS